MKKIERYALFLEKATDMGLVRAPTVRILLHLRKPRFYNKIHLELKIGRSSVTEIVINHPNLIIKSEMEGGGLPRTGSGSRFRVMLELSDDGWEVVEDLITS